MPAPFQRLTVADFADLLSSFAFTRAITAIHLHHTWRPNHAQFRGHDSIVAMWRFHTEERKFSDIAQHLTIDPQGFLWTGRDLNRAPASAAGHNGNSFSGPFMIELVGDFDKGKDVFTAPQEDVTWDVVKLLLTRFNLAPDSLVFHNQMAPKSCPGTAFDRASILAMLGSRSAPKTAGKSTPETVAQARAAWSAAAGTRASDPPDAELDYVDELQHNWQDRSGVRSGDSSLASDELDLLRPHVVNLRMGRFSNDGLMTGSEADVDRLFDEALPAWIGQLKTDQVPRVVFYAHGGLVKESTALKSALATRRWWLDNGVYPIYFVWETGLFETLGSMLHRGRDQLAPVGERGVISDRITDPLLEELVRALGAQRIWGAMKASAYFASAEKGGARYVAKKLATFVKGAGKSAELHAVGHSAGSIFHAHFLPVCRDVAKTGFPGFKTLQLLAPAINCEDFKQHLMPLGGQAGGVASMTMFTMRKDLERADNCAAVYRKSLLYLVSEACEDQRKTPILGLEQSLRNDSAIKAFFGLGLNAPAVAEVVWSKSPLVEGRSATRATRHGDFDNDAPTMTSVVRRILGKGEIDPVLPFPKQASTGDRSLANEWLSEVDWPDWAVGSGLPATALLPGTTPPTVSAASSSGRRLAVCIGIDAYSRAPLQGCVNDARRWSETLRSFGFDVEKLENDKADRDGILKALRDLIAHSRAGDTLVFQYAGHGTQLEDLDGDEADGDTPGYDEAIVPYGYESGAFVIDDDIAAIVTTLPADVRLTFLLDCCHSGTGTRFAVGGALTPRTQGDSRARRLPATPEMMVAHRRFRQGSGSRGFAAGIGARNASHTMREITLAACQSHELAYETGGQGDFTRLAHQVLARRVAGLTNVGFYESVLQEFGPGPRQRPRLDCDLTVRTAPLLGIAWS